MAHKLGIIGYGGMGAWHQESVDERIEAIAVKGVWDVREEACAKAAQKGLKVYASAEDLLADPELDMVTIATPNNFHRELSIKSLRAGKATICEKPVTMNAAELEDIIAVSRETGKLFTVHQNRRWDKDYLAVKQLLASGAVGRPYFLESRVQGSRGAMHGWRGYKLNGGGMLLDWGVHLLDQMLNLIDSPVVSVQAHLFGVFTPEVDDNIKLLLRFENKVSALLEMATNCFINLPRWHVSGTDGTAVVEDWACNGRVVKLSQAGDLAWDDDIVYTEAGPTRTMAPRPAYTTQVLPLPSPQPDWTEFYNNVVDAIDNGAPLLVTPQQALRVMQVIDLLFESEQQGRSMACYL